MNIQMGAVISISCDNPIILAQIQVPLPMSTFLLQCQPSSYPRAKLNSKRFLKSGQDEMEMGSDSMKYN